MCDGPPKTRPAKLDLPPGRFRVAASTNRDMGRPLSPMRSYLGTADWRALDPIPRGTAPPMSLLLLRVCLMEIGVALPLLRLVEFEHSTIAPKGVI
jgi:hypothetical protein